MEAAPPRAIILQPVDVHECGVLLSQIRLIESARGIPILAVLGEAPVDDLPAGADAYLIDPSDDDLLDVLSHHLVEAWIRSSGGQNARDIIESLDECVLAVDREHRIIYYNAHAVALLHRTSRRSDPLLASPLERAMPAFATGEARDALRVSLEQAETAKFELRVGAQWLGIHVSPSPDGATIIARDITQQRAAEDELFATRMRLARSEKLAFLGELVTGIAHEVRTPLVGLGNHLELLRAEVPRFISSPTTTTGAKITENIAQAWGAWERAVRVMRDVQPITRLDPPVRARIDLSIATQAAVTLFAATSPGATNVRVSLEMGLFVQADARKLQQAVLNLLQNAIEATEGPRVPVEIMTCRRPDGRAELLITDQGAGMTQDIVDRMYDPLFTTKKDATGLGLGIVQRVVRDHDGTITCDSVIGRGTTFTIVLPLLEEVGA